MKCPHCSYPESKVVDSRPTDENSSIRRRRECLQCQYRFTTYEVIEDIPLIVIKKDKTREEFDRNKLISGIVKACQKRPVTMKQMEQIATDIETQIRNSLAKEVTSQYIGELALEHLMDLDEVAYVRFASVHREFKDLNSFRDELAKLRKNKQKKN